MSEQQPTDWHGRPPAYRYECRTCRVGMSADSVPAGLERAWEAAHPDDHDVIVTIGEQA